MWNPEEAMPIISSLSAFDEAMNRGDFLPQTKVDLSYCDLRDQDIQNFLRLWSKPEFPSMLRVDLQHNQITDQALVGLIKKLETGLGPQSLWLDLGHNPITQESLKRVFQFLRTSHAFETLRFGFDDSLITLPELIHQLRQAGTWLNGLRVTLKPRGLSMMWSHQPRFDGLHLDIRDLDIEADGIKTLCEWIQSGDMPQEMWINFGNHIVQDADAFQFAKALQDPKCPPRLRCDFNLHTITQQAAEAIRTAMHKATHIPGFRIHFMFGQRNWAADLGPIMQLIEVNKDHAKSHAFRGCLTLFHGIFDNNNPLSILRYQKDVLLTLAKSIFPEQTNTEGAVKFATKVISLITSWRDSRVQKTAAPKGISDDESLSPR